MPVAQSQSRSNYMTSPKSSIRSRRSRRNRVASRLNREDGGAGGQDGSSPSVATSQSHNFTHGADDSLLASTQHQQAAADINEGGDCPRLVSHTRSRRPAHTSMSHIARMDLLRNNLGPVADPHGHSPALVSFYGCQSHPTCQSVNQSPELHISAQDPELSP